MSERSKPKPGGHGSTKKKKRAVTVPTKAAVLRKAARRKQVKAKQIAAKGPRRTRRHKSQAEAKAAIKAWNERFERVQRSAAEAFRADKPIAGFRKVAELSMIDERTLRRWCREHADIRARFYKIGGRYYLDPSDLLSLNDFLWHQSFDRGVRSARTVAAQARDGSGKLAKKKKAR